MRTLLAVLTFALVIATPAAADRREDHPVLPTDVRPPATHAARAAVASECDALPGYECGSIDVPMDRSDPSLGTTPISYAIRPHDDQSVPAAGTTLVSDAPGGATLTEFGGFLFPFSTLGDLAATHDLLLVDVRGTGADPLDCPDYQHGTAPWSESIPACAAQLGAARDFYTYGDDAGDMEAVRAALGIGKVDVYATGHASALAEAYAIRHSEHVRSLILDSPTVLLQWPDADLRGSIAVAGRICRRSPLCSALIDDPEGEIAWLARRLRAHPLTGTGYDADGVAHDVRLGEEDLAFKLLFDKQGAQRTQAELPAAARALRRGDAVPLLRLAAENDFPLGPIDEGDPAEWSVASVNAAFCAEWPFGWDKSAPRATRLAQFEAARAALPRDFFAPFSLAAGTAVLPDQCLEWPPPARTNPIMPPGRRYPGVPVMVISGDHNTDHAIELSATVAKRYPNARFVPIPQATQSAAGSSPCARRIIQSFVSTLQTGDTRCRADEREAFPGVGGFPRHVRHYAPAEPVRGDHSTRRDRRVAAAAVETYLDALYAGLFRAQGTTGRVLRGGSYSIEFGDTGATFTLDGARLVEDVAVSGSAFFSFDPAEPNAGELTVRGRGTAPGVIELSDEPVVDNTVPKVHVTGTIGGRRLRLLVPIH